MWVMATKRDDPKRMYVRPPEQVLHEMQMLVTALKSPKRYGAEGITQELFVAASWLWMVDMGVDAVAEGVKPYLERVKQLRREDKARLSATQTIQGPLPGTDVTHSDGTGVHYLGGPAGAKAAKAKQNRRKGSAK
jgi:hypothetical protein